jgi:nanoRNase/pAp phosphatase (c-di-AMP/oligoRNAs hydrolase)
MRKFYKNFYKKIKEYEYIVISRHINSDLDCLGSQFALKEWINLNFKNKKVYCIGENHQKYINEKKFFPSCDKLDNIDKPFLGICVDVNQISRVDGGDILSKADYTICIDHHVDTDADKFDLMYVDSKKISCAQIIAKFILKYSAKNLNQNICKYLFVGISGDSGNFYFEGCDSETFEVSSKLISIGKFNVFNDYHAYLSLEKLDDYRIKSKIFEKIVYDKESGFAYYINSIADLKDIGVTAHGANEKIGGYNRIEEFEIILAAAEYEEGLYRSSIRSKFIPIVDIANKYGGGGHKFACGVKGLTLEKLESLIADLKKCKKN